MVPDWSMESPSFSHVPDWSRGYIRGEQGVVKPETGFKTGLPHSIFGVLESVRIRPNPSESDSLPNPSESRTPLSDNINLEPKIAQNHSKSSKFAQSCPKSLKILATVDSSLEWTPPGIRPNPSESDPPPNPSESGTGNPGLK